MRLRSVLFASSMLAVCMVAKAQRDYQLVQGSNVWLGSSNAAALTTYDSCSISIANISGKYDWGSLRNFSDGKHHQTVDASVCSYTRLSPKVVGYGKVGYSNFTGTDMQGSVFWKRDADLLAFDIVEDSLNHAGKKHCEVVNIVGGVGWNVIENLSIGAMMDFYAGTYAKYRDLRHTNSLTDINGLLSAFYHVPRYVDFGASLMYRRSIQSVKFKTFGQQNITYMSLVSYANMIGSVELLSSDGFIDGYEKPLFDEYAGVSIQCATAYDSEQWLKMYGAFAYLHRNGYYGNSSQYTINYVNHVGDVYKWNVRLKHDADNSMQWLDLALCSSKLSASNSNYMKVESSSNSSVIYYNYYTPTKISDKLLTTASIAYNGYFGKMNRMYMWNVKAGADIWHRNQTGYVYPYYRNQSLTQYTPFANVSRLFAVGEGSVLTARLGLAYRWGEGDMCNDGTLSQPSELQSFPDEQASYLKQEYDYITARQAMLNVAAEYLFRLPDSSVQPVVALGYSLKRAYTKSMADTNRNSIVLTVGAVF